MEKIKFTPEEMVEIKDVGTKYQEKMFQFGQLYLERINLDKAFRELQDKEKKLQADYAEIEKMETTISEKLTEKYGEGSLSLSDGTFIPAKK